MTDPQGFKIVVTGPNDTDPPTSTIATYDGVIGINPPVVPTKDMATPYDYGAVGDGVTDDTLALQNWLNAIAGTAGFVPVGTFSASSTLQISANTTIYGAGRGSATIQTLPAFPANNSLLVNRNPGVDTNIAIYGVCFQGSSTDATTGPMVSLGATGVVLRDCLFQHWRNDFVAIIPPSSAVVIDSCEFTDWGTLPASNTSVGVWLGSLNGKSSHDLWVMNCIFHGGQCGAILVGPDDLPTDDVHILNNKFESTLGSCIFGGMNYSEVIGNSFNGVRLCLGVAHAMEIQGGEGLVIAHNNFIDIDLAAIYLTNPVICTVVGNNINRPCQSLSSGLQVGSAGAITVRSLDGTTHVERLTIANNTISCSNFLASYGIAFYDFGGGGMNNVLVQGNNLAPASQWQGKAISFDDPDAGNPVGSNFMIRNNNGGAQTDISTSAVNFVIKQGTTGSFRVGSVGFYPSRIEFMAVLPTAATSANASIGQQTWETGWDVTTSAITSAKSYLTAIGMAWAADGTKGHSEDTSGRSSITVVDTSGHPICIAGVTALDEDGFTLTINSSPRAAVNAGGSGYAVGDTGTVDGGDSAATYTVLTVSGGAVTALSMSGGSGYVNATGSATTHTTGSGTGLTLDLFSSSPTTNDVVVTAVCHA